MKYSTLLLCVLFSTGVLAEKTMDEKYIENYVQQIKPLLKEKLTRETSVETVADADMQITNVATRMAECQLLVLNDYPLKYQEAAIVPVANGKHVRQVTDDVNAMMLKDIEAGEITTQELDALVESSTEKYKACLN